jgi:thiosulfate/3-mercaptopyruvate sulfurtransferase
VVGRPKAARVCGARPGVLEYEVMTAPTLPVPLVSVSWLKNHIDEPGLVVLDATFHPAPPAEWQAKPIVYLPHARVFDFDKRICDPSSSLPHMMPGTELFEREVRALGVRRDSRIVVYDRIGTFSSPRGWWMFRSMGHDQVAVLDGGLPAWLEAGLPVVEVPEAVAGVGNFVAQPREGLFVDADRVAAALDSSGAQVLDARSEGRFFGREPEPRAGLRSGHMPTAINLPYSSLQSGGRMRPPQELEALFAARVNGDPQLIFSCGSGVTACVLALGAALAGRSYLSVYDGSWSEWGQPSSRPVVTS